MLWASLAANLRRLRMPESSAISAGEVASCSSPARARCKISSGVPPHSKAETTTLVSSTARTGHAQLGSHRFEFGFQLRFADRRPACFS